MIGFPLLPLISLQNIIFQPVQATNNDGFISWKIIQRWSIYGNHYRDHPLYVNPAPIILYPAHPINRERKVRKVKSLRRSRNYHARQRIQN